MSDTIDQQGALQFDGCCCLLTEGCAWLRLISTQFG